jgi:hypothetical protein
LRVTLCAAACAAVFARPARADDVPFQGAAYGGLECYDGCTHSGFVLGVNGFWTPGRVGALGVLLEHTDTSGERGTGTTRAGLAGRAYFARDDLIEPYAQSALGPAWFRDRSAPCTVEAMLFLQGTVGLDVRLVRGVFAGAAFSATQQGYGTDCGAESDRTNWNTGPTYGFLLVLRGG